MISGKHKLYLVTGIAGLFAAIGLLSFANNFVLGRSPNILQEIVKNGVPIVLLIMIFMGYGWARVILGIFYALSALIFIVVLGSLLMESILLQHMTANTLFLLGSVVILGSLTWLLLFSKPLRQAVEERGRIRIKKARAEREKFYQAIGETMED